MLYISNTLSWTDPLYASQFLNSASYREFHLLSLRGDVDVIHVINVDSGLVINCEAPAHPDRVMHYTIQLRIKPTYLVQGGPGS